MNWGAVVDVIVWNLNLQMPMESVPITTNIVGSTPAQGKIDNYICERNYNICIHYKFKYDVVGVDRWTDKSSKDFM
jgi:hypothetical protein